MREKRKERRDKELKTKRIKSKTGKGKGGESESERNGKSISKIYKEIRRMGKRE